MPIILIDIAGWRLEVDADVTAHAYEQLSVGCDCGYCRNLLAALDLLPPDFYHILQLLGINPAIPAEIIEYTQNPDGTHYYSWWYHANGQILTDHRVVQNEFGHAQRTPTITIGIGTTIYLAAPEFPQPIIQIEFWANLPWLLEESSNSNK